MRNALLAGALLLALPAAAGAVTLDAFDLDVTNAAGTASSITLDAGVTYKVTVSGTFAIAPGRLADGEFYQFAGTLDWTDVRPPDIGVQLDGMDIVWGPFASDHVYSTYYTGTGAALQASYLDVNYGDNSGALQMTISSVPLPAAGGLMLVGLGGLAALRRRRRT